MSTKRIFIAGDEWLYYKIYCGARTSDKILIEAIKPMVEHLKKQEMIDSWFFIRYADPDFHIRIRFHIKNEKHLGSSIQLVNKALKKYVTQQVIYKVQIDTYVRELERYGSSTIDISEKLFFYHSEMLLEAISLIEDEELYFLFVVKAIDGLLDNFKYSSEAKLKITSHNGQGFKKEFHADKTLNKQLDKKYRGIKNRLSTFIETPQNLEEYQFLTKLIKNKEAAISTVVHTVLKQHNTNILEVPLDNLVSSYIHMLVNRAFRSKQRFYELVCYDFLSKYYRSKISYTV